MDPLKSRLGAVVADVADKGAALFSAVWPRSMAKFDVERLEADGYTAGEPCDVDFSIEFDGAAAESALRAVRGAGFTLVDNSKLAKGRAGVRGRLRLRPYDLSRAESRLHRALAPFGGSAAVIGPAAPPSASAPLADAAVPAPPVSPIRADRLPPRAEQRA
jgi:hypothetical protein